MKVPKLLAAGLIAAGLVIGGSTVAHATTASPYVTVAWSYAGHPDLTQPQPYIASAAGADLHAFDALAATPAWCGQPIQVDVYKVTDEHGRSWETLKTSGSLQYATDGGFLAYDAGIGTPYRVIAPKEIPCTTPTPQPTPTVTPAPTPSSTPTSSPTPGPTSSPSPTTPAPSETSAPSPTPSTTTPASPPTGEPTPTGTHQPTATATPSTPRSERKSTPSATASAAPASSPTSTDQLAYTGANPWPGIAAASVLILLGAVLLLARRVRRG